MPVQRCQKDSKPGYKWGTEGTCYTYMEGNERSELKALELAKRQGRAIEIKKQNAAREGSK